MNIVILLALTAIVATLAGAGFFMLRRGSEAPGQRSKHMAKALAWRVGLSVTLFLFVLLAYSLGWIEPRGIPISR
jgi:purine-cytosine permease-like protein